MNELLETLNCTQKELKAILLKMEKEGLVVKTGNKYGIK